MKRKLLAFLLVIALLMASAVPAWAVQSAVVPSGASFENGNLVLGTILTKSLSKENAAFLRKWMNSKHRMLVYNPSTNTNFGSMYTFVILTDYQSADDFYIGSVLGYGSCLKIACGFERLNFIDYTKTNQYSSYTSDVDVYARDSFSSFAFCDLSNGVIAYSSVGLNEACSQYSLNPVSFRIIEDGNLFVDTPDEGEKDPENPFTPPDVNDWDGYNPFAPPDINEWDGYNPFEKPSGGQGESTINPFVPPEIGTWPNYNPFINPYKAIRSWLN